MDDIINKILEDKNTMKKTKKAYRDIAESNITSPSDVLDIDKLIEDNSSILSYTSSESDVKLTCDSNITASEICDKIKDIGISTYAKDDTSKVLSSYIVAVPENEIIELKIKR